VLSLDPDLWPMAFKCIDANGQQAGFPKLANHFVGISIAVAMLGKTTQSGCSMPMTAIPFND
jgi:hypothetical protein